MDQLTLVAFFLRQNACYGGTTGDDSIVTTGSNGRIHGKLHSDSQMVTLTTVTCFSHQALQESGRLITEFGGERT